MIFDTDVIIWVQRGKEKAAHLIDNADFRGTSIVSYMEFIQFAHDKKMLSTCKNFFNNLDFVVLPITPDISHRAAVFVEQFSLSHNLQMPDAFIAATAFELGVPLVTSNYKDYKMIEGLQIVKLAV